MKEFREVVAINPDFRVVADADDWIVVEKAAPLIVYPANGKPEPSLLGGVEALLSYEMANGAKLSIINRLDRETSGIVLIAKNATAARKFGRAMERRQFQKEYDALCYGWPEWDEQLVCEPILRKGEIDDSPIWLKQMVHAEGKECETLFRVASKHEVRGAKVTKLRVFPKSGRMHQIRVHAQHLGFPLIGDKIYGIDERFYLQYIEGVWTEELARKLMLPRHALHAAAMSVELEGEALEWRVELAEDLQWFLDAGIARL